MKTVQNLLNMIAGKLNNYCTIVTFTDSQQTIAAGNAVTRENIPVGSAVPSGYKAIGAIPKFIGSYQCYAYSCGINSDQEIVYQIRNISNAQVKISPQFQIICVKE